MYRNNRVLVSCSAACVSATRTSVPRKPIARIINGWEGKLDDAPHQVAFKKLVESEHFNTFCGGSIVSAEVVISAAHCFVEDPTFWQRIFYLERTLIPLSGIYAVAGTIWDTNSKRNLDSVDEQWRAIRSVHSKRSYVFPYDDICIVFLTEPFVFNSYVNYISLATQNADYVGTCLASGFGLLTRNRELALFPGRLMLAHLVLVRNEECSVNLQFDTCKFVCTSQEHTDTAPGDSGGPLVCYNFSEPKKNRSTGVLIGVTCGNMYMADHSYGLFTRISMFTDYINSSINGVDRNFDSQISNIWYLILYIVKLLFYKFVFFNYICSSNSDSDKL